MRITILNGNMTSENVEFDDFINKIASNISLNNTVKHFTLNNMNLYYCTGCWSCWWKTPGLCALQDDADIIFKSVINSDFVIFASPIYAGFTSSLLKLITDRLIILLHPYIEIIQKECHHKKRYEKYPKIGLIIQKGDDTDKEDIKIITDIYKRFTLNFHSKLSYVKFLETKNLEEIVNETCNI
jgi:multimeric flavodoxin WrbA